MTHRPLIVALCGRPGSGKSEIQKILHSKFGLLPFDDGEILRRHCMEWFDLSPEDVLTQHGKARFTDIDGVTWQNRKIIGEYGNAMETLFGPNCIPIWALRQASRDFQSRLARGERPTGYSFGSVRRSQGETYRQAGGIVLEITRPGQPETGNIWDGYDIRHVTHSYVNNEQTLEGMAESFASFFSSIMR